MKLSLCFLALLAFASCETSFRPHEFYSEIPKTLEDCPHKDGAEFYVGLFSHFGLGTPKQIIFECLSDFSAGILIGELYTANQILTDINARDFKHAHHDIVKQIILSFLGHGSANCIVATQDFSDLLEALDIKRDPFLDGVGQWFDFQANFPRLLEDYKPVIQNLDHRNFTAAGAAYGDVLNHTVAAVKSKGFYFLGHQGVANGFSFGLDLDLPDDTLGIWNDTTSAYDLEFAWESARAVAEGHWWDSYENLIKYYEEKGVDVLKKIPASVWEALQKSEDNKKVTERLGIDVMTKEFGELAGHWIKKNQWKYHAYSKEVLKNLEHLDMIHVGALQAGLVREIARTK